MKFKTKCGTIAVKLEMLSAFSFDTAFLAVWIHYYNMWFIYFVVWGHKRLKFSSSVSNLTSENGYILK